MQLVLLILFSFMSLISTNQDFTVIKDNNLYSYNEKDAITYAYVSSLPYCDIDQIIKFNCGEICDYLVNFDVLAVFESDAGKDSISYVIIHDLVTQTLVISFRGTTNFQQLVTELTNWGGVTYTLHEVGDVQVLDYFYNHYINDLRDQFLSDFNNINNLFQNQITKIIFTGHSLGAAMSTHAAADLLFSNTISSNSHDIQMYSFGQPRVGDYYWTVALKQKLNVNYRVVHNADIVAHIPYCNPLSDSNSEGACKKSGGKFWYPYQITQEIWYKNDDFSSYKICDPIEGEDKNCSDSLLVNYSVQDHKNYFGVQFGQCKLA